MKLPHTILKDVPYGIHTTVMGDIAIYSIQMMFNYLTESEVAALQDSGVTVFVTPKKGKYFLRHVTTDITKHNKTLAMCQLVCKAVANSKFQNKYGTEWVTTPYFL